MKRITWYGKANEILGSSLTPNNRCIAKKTARENGADQALLAPFEENRLVPVSALRKLVSEYTVIFKDYDGTTLDDRTITEGNTISYVPADPTRTGWTFTGWKGSDNTEIKPSATRTYPLPTPTGSVVYTAQYTINKYTIYWYKGAYGEADTTLIDTTSVDYGTIPSHAAPEKTGYTFVRWQTQGGDTPYAANKDERYYSIFTRNAVYHTVTWKNWDGTVLEVDNNVLEGSMPEYNGATPTRTGYVFSGWSPATSLVYSDQTYTAQFNQILPDTYTIRWYIDGELKKTEQVESGTVPSYGSTPSKSGYTWSGWNPTPYAANKNQDYTSTFTPNTYRVRWYNGSTLLETDNNVPYGTTPEYNGETPTTSDSTKMFSHWEDSNGNRPSAVTGNVDYYAQFGPKTTYHIEFRGIPEADDSYTALETLLSAQDVPAGMMPEIPENEFTNYIRTWDHEVTVATKDDVYYATYQYINPDFYLINWYDGDRLLATSQVAPGRVPVYPYDIPMKEGQSFYGWQNANGDAPYEANKNENYYAQYGPFVIWTVKWLDGHVLNKYTGTPEVPLSDHPMVKFAEQKYVGGQRLVFLDEGELPDHTDERYVVDSIKIYHKVDGVIAFTSNYEVPLTGIWSRPTNVVTEDLCVVVWYRELEDGEEAGTVYSSPIAGIYALGEQYANGSGEWVASGGTIKRLQQQGEELSVDNPDGATGLPIAVVFKSGETRGFAYPMSGYSTYGEVEDMIGPEFDRTKIYFKNNSDYVGDSTSKTAIIHGTNTSATENLYLRWNYMRAQDSFCKFVYAVYYGNKWHEGMAYWNISENPTT